jgi:hypothetical protein
MALQTATVIRLRRALDVSVSVTVTAHYEACALHRFRRAAAGVPGILRRARDIKTVADTAEAPTLSQVPRVLLVQHGAACCSEMRAHAPTLTVRHRCVQGLYAALARVRDRAQAVSASRRPADVAMAFVTGLGAEWEALRDAMHAELAHGSCSVSDDARDRMLSLLSSP